MARDIRRDRRHGEEHKHVQELGESLRELVVSKLAEKASSRQKDSVKGRLQAEALDLVAERISALDLWTRMPPGERRTRVTRDELAAAAVRIADADGFDGLSMRRLAQELGVGTMTLYHYVRNKEELLTLVHDAVMGEVVVPDGRLPDDWREAITVIATRSRDALLRHPWVLEITDDPPLGPNSVRHFDQTLQAVSSLDVSLAERLDIASTIDEFVFGFCLFERNNADAGVPAKDDMVAYVSVLLETDAFPTLKEIVEEVGLDGLWDVVRATFTDGDRFRRHLDRILDGIEAEFSRRR